MSGTSFSSLPHGALTDVGIQRREGVNQDSIISADLPVGALFAIADGMGGHAAGELASRVALETLVETLRTKKGPLPVRLPQAVQEANLSVLRHAVGENVGMGTTLVALVIDKGAAIIAHAGDCRAYLLRERELRQLTQDHSWVAEQVRLGNMTEEEARVHQWRNIVSNGLGGEERVRLDLQGVALRRGDRLLLCSDGLCGVLPDETMQQELLLHHPPQETCAALVRAANAAGGPDNISVIVIDVERDARLPTYSLPQVRPDGPLYADLLMEAYQSNNPLHYLILVIAYFTVLGVMLFNEQSFVIAILGIGIMMGLFMWRRRSVKI